MMWWDMLNGISMLLCGRILDLPGTLQSQGVSDDDTIR